jgi:PAS domain S-box-containing protein
LAERKDRLPAEHRGLVEQVLETSSAVLDELHCTAQELRSALYEIDRRGLHESEASFRTIVDFTYDWEYWIGPDGDFVYCSPSCERITGYRPQEFLEEPELLERITHPDDRVRARGHLREERMDGAVYSLDYRIITRGGEERWISHVCQSVCGEDGEWLGWRASNRDITARKRMEQELRESEQRFRTVADFTHDWEYWLGLDGKYIYVSPSCERVTGYPADAFKEDPTLLQEITYPDDRAAVEAHFGEEAQGAGVRFFDFRIITRDGHVRWVNHVCRPVYDSGGEPLGWRGSNRDVTDRKRAEVERERLLRQVQELAARLVRERELQETIMENTRAHLAYLDSSFKFVRVNQAYAQGSGHSKEELIGRNHFDLFPHAENQAIFQQVVDTGQPVEFQARPFEFEDQPERGITYWDWTLVPVTDRRSRLQGLVLSLLEVTERERARRALQESEDRFRTIADFTHDWEYWIGPNGNFVYVSPSCERITGYRPGEFLEDPELLERITHPDDRASIRRHLREERMDGAVHSLDYRITTRRGEERWIGHVCQSVHGEDGQWLGWRASNRNITERKRIEEQVRRYGEQLRVLHEIDEAILAAGSARDVAAAALHGLRKLVSCSRCTVELFDDEGQSSLILALSTADGELGREGRWQRLICRERVEELAAGRLFVVEDVRTLPPSPFPDALREQGVLSIVSVPLAVEGKLIGCLSLGRAEPGSFASEDLDIVRDVADQVAIGARQAQLYRQAQLHAEGLEQLVTKRTSELRASEARFRAIFEHAAVGVGLGDTDGRLLAANPALQEMLGYSEEELKGITYTELTHPDDLAVSAELYGELVAGQCDDYTVETRYVRKDGRLIWGRLTASLVRGSDDEAQYAIGMVEDITEQRQAREALIRSEKLAITGQLAASLAHEINNPLQTVIGCLGLAEESLAQGGGEDLQEYITIAHDELRRTARIVSALRDLSRPTDVGAGEPCDVNGLLERVLKLSQKEFENRKVDVVRRLADDLPRPVLVPDRIRQVFLNLVLNAVEAMPEGGRLTVESRQDERSGEVVVTIIDDGPGIPKGVLARIFDPFFSTKSGGMGLGLFVSQGIAQEHGGSIEVESEVGHGARFSVHLPV